MSINKTTNLELIRSNQQGVGDYEFQPDKPSELSGNRDYGFCAGLLREYKRAEYVMNNREEATASRSLDKVNIVSTKLGDSTQAADFLDLIPSKTLNFAIRILNANGLEKEAKVRELEVIAAEVDEPRKLFEAGDFLLSPSVMHLALRKDLEQNYRITALHQLLSLDITDPQFEEIAQRYETEFKDCHQEQMAQLLFYGLPSDDVRLRALPSYAAILNGLIDKAELHIKKHSEYVKQKNLVHFWNKVQNKAPFNSFESRPIFDQNDTLAEKAGKVKAC